MTVDVQPIKTANIPEPAPARDRNVQLHPLSRRIMHWINALAIIVMIASGWRIYNYYPALPIHFGFPNYLTLGGDFTVTEALNDEDGLANALAWHFGAMWVLVINFLAFVIVGFASGHYRRDFLPVSPRAFLRDVWAALRFKLDHNLGEYNAVQKVLYWGVLGAILRDDPVGSQHLEAGPAQGIDLAVWRVRIRPGRAFLRHGGDRRLSCRPCCVEPSGAEHAGCDGLRPNIG